jgi:hypothetical protein
MDARKLNYSEETPSPVCFVHHKSHTDYPQSKSDNLRQDTCNYSHLNGRSCIPRLSLSLSLTESTHSAATKAEPQLQSSDWTRDAWQRHEGIVQNIEIFVPFLCARFCHASRLTWTGFLPCIRRLKPLCNYSQHFLLKFVTIIQRKAWSI